MMLDADDSLARDILVPSPPPTAEDIAEVLISELFRRDQLIAAALARIEALECTVAANGPGPDLDGRINLKSAAFQLRCSIETIRKRCAAGQIDAAKDRGQWRVKL